MGKWLKTIVPLIVIALMMYGVYLAFFDIQSIEGQEVLREVLSPDGSNTLIVYLNNSGATTDYAVLCAVKNNQNGRRRNVYWQYHCTDANVRWVDDDTVAINGRELDVWKDSYDYRREEE